MDKATLLAEQYADASNLSTRGEFNDRYTASDRHPHEWAREHLSLPPDGAVLDLGCGPGAFWAVDAAAVPGGWDVTLADFSRGRARLASVRTLLSFGRHGWVCRRVENSYWLSSWSASRR